MTTRAYLDAVRKRCEAATAGPWTHDDRLGYDGIVQGEPANCGYDKPYVAKCANDRNGPGNGGPIWLTNKQDFDNAAFIASARTDLPKLERIARLADDYREAVRKGNIESISADETRCALFAALEELK